MIVLYKVLLSSAFKFLSLSSTLSTFFAAGRQDDSSAMLLLVRLEISVRTITDSVLMAYVILARKGGSSSVRIYEGAND